jgi:signal transduction histidine kinase
VDNKIVQLRRPLVFSKQAFLFYAAVSITAVPLSFGLLHAGVSWLATWGLGITSTLVTYLFFLLFLIAIQRKHFSHSLFEGIIFLIFLGLIRGALIFYGAAIFGLEDPSALRMRLLNSAVTTLIWLGLSSILVEGNRRYQRRYRAIINQVLIANMRSSASLDPSFALVARDLAKIQVRLQATYSKSQEGISNPVIASSAAREIREQIDNALKPLSHRLWLNSIYEYPKLRILSLLIQATKNLNFPLALLIIIYGVTTTFNYSVTFGIQKGVIRALTGTACLLIMELVRRAVIAKWQRIKIAANLTYLVFIGLFVSLASTISTDALEIGNFLPYYMILAPEVGGLMIVISAVYLAATDREEILKSLRGQLDSTNALLHIGYASNTAGNVQLASYLHNSLQSELSAIALQLERVAEDPKSGEVDEVLERFSAIVNRSMSEDLLNYLEVPEVRYRRILKSWVGIAEISDEIDIKIFDDNSRSTLFVQLIQEAISNAVRKGGAKSIQITAVYSADVLKVAIRNDGAFDPNTKKGIGHQWIDRFAVSDWRISADMRGTLLEVDF